MTVFRPQLTSRLRDQRSTSRTERPENKATDRARLRRNAGALHPSKTPRSAPDEVFATHNAFHSSDYDSFALLNKAFGGRCVICADDIYASNPERTRVGIDKNCARAMIVKPNQVGTITGAKKTSALAKENGMEIILSNRSGETPDDSISHLAVAWNASGIKAGVRGGARIVKLNELIRIEQAAGQIKLVPWKY